MAELYENPKQYLTAGGYAGSTPTGEPSFEDMLSGLPPEEREEAMQYITAPPSGEEIMKAMQQKNSQGEVMNMSVEQYRLFKAHNKAKEVDVIAGIGEAASTVFDEIQKAAGSIVDNPADALQKLTPSVIEAFAQGTRNMYGMAAQSADPNSIFFRMKNALQANGDDEEAELQQFMEAQAFNVHSMRLMTGQDTLIMDKDVINPEMTQVMSYIADPSLFVPFGGLAAKGATMIGMGEKLAMAAARTQGIRNLVLGGAIKWGVGAPLEFMGGAIRNTIDYGIDTGSRVFETATGVAAKDIASATRIGTLGTAAGSVAGLEVNLSLGAVSRYYAGSLVARNVGEAVSIYGEQMMKQGKTGRGVLGYAGQAIRDTERAGIKLAPHTKSLLKAIEAVDPLFVYADDIAQGAAHGAIIGGGLGYLGGGEEGFAGGVGSGMALGTVGATAGKVVADLTGNTKIDQMRIQRKLVIEALKENGNENAVGFEAMAAMAEATGDRAFMGYIDGIIAGIDTVNPDAVFKAYNKVQYDMHLKSKGIDPNTGVLLEKSRIFPELNDRTVKADVLGILRDTGGNFAGDPAGFEQAVKNNPAYAKVKPIWNKLDDNAKQVILKQIKDNGDPAFTKSLKGRQLNAHWSDMAYAEKATEIVNTLNQKNANSVPAKVADLLKAETRSDKKLTRRGQMLKEKLQADGYIDKDGNVRTSRLKDVEGTQGEFEASAGWTKSRDSTGRTEIVINLDKWAMDSGNRLSLAHELYHSIMLDSVFAPDYIDRLSQKLLGKFDPKTGRVLEQALVQPDELMKFFGRYIENDPNNRGDAETIKRKKEELQKSIEEYRTRGTANRVADATAIPLEHLVEEFGAYYFSKWVKAQPIDYMFRGGEFGGIRGLMEMASDGWLDYWKGKVNEKNPQFNFDGMGVSSVSKAFERDGKRVSSRSLDLFMRDIVRIEANRNSNNGFDVNKLSKESREWFLKVNGLRGAAFGQLDQQGNVKKPKLRRYTSEEIRQGKEMFKVLESLPDAAHKDGMRRDGDGNWSGQPNTAQINALVGAGYIQRAWFDRMTRAYDIVNGNGSNVVEFGYLGYSAHIGDGNERVYGAAVPFKNRRAVLIGVDFKVRADGTVFSNLHTLDLKVIEARGNEVWKDPQTRELWKGSRTDMEADFYAYLSNASLPSDHPNRKPSAKILDKGDGLGGQRRDALHQMLGFHKGSDLPYINRPIAEIPVGIRHSVTTFSNDGIVNMRVDNKPRYDFNFENAHLDLSRNFMPDEMRQETTPSGGKIIKHATGYQISKQAGTKFKVFDPEGKHLGDFDTVADAGRAAQKHFNETFDKSVEGKDAPVPPTEIPPSRKAYIEKEHSNALWQHLSNKSAEFKDGLISAIDAWLNTYGKHYEEGRNYTQGDKNLIENTKLVESIKKALEENSKNPPENLIHGLDTAIDGESTYGRRIWANESNKTESIIRQQYDAMYPMEIKSALHPRLAQIFQDYPNLTAQGLLKKLVVYGSQGSRMFQEATEIGLVDMLKSKIQKTTTPRFMPDGTVIEMAQGVTQPKLDMAEILDFAKSKEIKVTIEEGARERSGMDTSKYTLGGAKDNYKQTAIRINPEYAHGIRGHYGKDTIVHFRTTERLDADGNRHLYVEEVQANNSSVKSGLSQQEIKDIEIDRDVHLPIYREILAEGKKQGRYVSNEEDGYTSQKKGVIDYVSVSSDLWTSGYADDIVNGMALDWDYRLFQIGINTNAEEWIKNTVPKAMVQLYHEIERGLRTKEFKDSTSHFFKILKDEFRVYKRGEHEADYIQFCKDISETAEVQKLIDLVSKDAVLEGAWREYLYNVDQVKNQGYIAYLLYSDRPDNLLERISDIETSVQQLNQQKTAKPLPLTAAKDWTLTALKGIIRQAIRDGLDKITLTHPDDSPTVSHMNGDARKGLYGKLIPEVWGSWLRKYGIEMKQTNKLADATIDTAKGQMAEITNKLHDANKAVLEHFEQVKGGEDPVLIQNVAELLAMPVHMADLTTHLKIEKIASRLNDNKLIGLINEVALLKGAEFNAYERINKLREGGVRGDSNLKSDTGAGISAEAIDRGMTFELNDRLKRDFLDGKIQTHAMPAEGGFDFEPNSKKAMGMITEYLYALRTGSKPQDLRTPELDYLFNNIEHFAKASDDDILYAISKVGQQGDAIIERFKSGEITLKQATEQAKNVDQYTYLAQLKDIRDERKQLYKSFLRASGEMRQISDNDGRRYNTHAERESRNNRYFQPAEYQGGDDYYKPKKNPFESKDEQGFLIRSPFIVEDPNRPLKKTVNPNSVRWENIGHFHQRLTSEVTGGMSHEDIFKWENKNMGLWAEKTSDEKVVIKDNISATTMGYTYTHREWFQQGLAGIGNDKWGRYEKPIYDKAGNLVRRGRISITSQYRGQIKNMKHAYEIKNRIAEKLKFKPEDADAYLFDASDSIKQSMGFSSKDTLPIKFQPAEGGSDYKWFKRNKYNNIPKEREIVIDKILTDVFENKMSYAEAAKANNENRVNVAKLVNNYVKNNPSARSLIPSETIKNHQFKWYVPDTEAHAYPLSKAVKIDEAMDDVISKSMLIKDSAKKHSIDIDVLTYAISNARERGSQFENQLGGVGSNTRSKELYSLNKETGRMKISEENRKAIQSMYFDEGYSQKQVAESFGISKAIVQDILKENNRTSKNFQPDELIQNGFEKSELNKKLLDSKHIVLGFDERILEGKAVVINNPDIMMTGELKTNDGRTLIEGEGGLNFVAKFGDVWANSVKPKAETTASKLRQSQKENNGVAYLALTRGELTKALNSHTGAKGAMAILEYFVEQGYISLEEFRNALKDSGRKYGINFNATKSAKDIHAEIAQKFFGIEDSSFEKRGFFVTDVITHLAKKGKSGNENIAKIREALGSDRLGRTIKFKAKGIKEAIGLMISDKRANVEPSHVYAYIEVTGNISVEKTENGHKSYPYHIVQRDENGNKIRPRMLIPDKTNYVTDVILDSNKDVVLRLVKDKNGRNMSGAVMLGSNNVGEAFGYVRPAKDIPEGKPRLKWQPSEYSEFKSEQSATGRILRNAKGYVIMVSGDKFKVYNPYKAMVGIYTDLEQAKRRVQREEPKK